MPRDVYDYGAGDAAVRQARSCVIPRQSNPRTGCGISTTAVGTCVDSVGTYSLSPRVVLGGISWNGFQE